MNNISRITNKLSDITSPPSTILEKKLFNDSNMTNIGKIKNQVKNNRNRSLVNIINNKDDDNMDNYNDNHCEHINNDIRFNSKKKYNRHFGNEENCPICVAIQMKNKLLEEKNKMLPILTKNNFRKNNEKENNKSPNKKSPDKKSPNKNKIMKTIYPRNKEKSIIRIGSGTSIFTNRKKYQKRNESVKQIRKIEITNNNLNEKEEEKFPVIKDYFN